MESTAALFVVPCSASGCPSGAHDLTSAIMPELRRGLALAWLPCEYPEQQLPGDAWLEMFRAAGFMTQYAEQQFYGNLQAKYIGKRFSTLTNDESVPGYWTVDLNAGYRFGDLGIAKNVTIRANISNLFDKRYLALNAGSGSLFTTNATGTGAAAPSYYIGAPRFASMSIGADF